MATNRLILLLVVIGILTILLIQNWSPALSLVMLGMKSKPLPLAIWLVLSITTGALTSWLITNLYQLSNSFGSQKKPSPPRRSYRAPRVQQDRRQEATFNTATAPKTPNKQDSKTQVIEDDWDADNSADDDWEFDQSPAKQKTQSFQNQPRKDADDYERPPQPTNKNQNQSDSVYSYSSREPKNTGVGKTESIYDADYRVIIPPYQPSPKNQQTDDDDWDFFDDDEDDDFDDGERLRR
ncbi:MAG: LapA family protein [Calothrix sp. MO_167.B12]|nr:LapA family protein [Calothrix sp. MO_167.B12]